MILIRIRDQFLHTQNSKNVILTSEIRKIIAGLIGGMWFWVFPQTVHHISSNVYRILSLSCLVGYLYTFLLSTCFFVCVTQIQLSSFAWSCWCSYWHPSSPDRFCKMAALRSLTKSTLNSPSLFFLIYTIRLDTKHTLVSLRVNLVDLGSPQIIFS